MQVDPNIICLDVGQVFLTHDQPMYCGSHYMGQMPVDLCRINGLGHILSPLRSPGWILL